MSWNILPKNVLQYFLTKLKGLMYTKTEVDNLIPSITPNPSTTTGVLNGLEIDGTAYEIQGTGEPNVQADWNEVDSTADDYIKNKPTIPTVTADGAKQGVDVDSGEYRAALCSYNPLDYGITGATYVGDFSSRTYDLKLDLGGRLVTVVPWEEQVNSDWNATSGKAQILNKPSLATVATSGSYNDLSNKPTIPDISTKVSKSGDTMTGALSTNCENNVAINLRPGNANWYDTIAVETAGNEAVVFGSKNAATSWMFVNGEDSITNHENNRWQSLTPGLQIKNNKVAIGKLIGNSTTPTHALDVNGNVQATTFNGYTIAKSVPSNAVFTDTNNKVEVIHSTSNAEYPIIFEGHNNQTTYTTAVYKTAFVLVNPYNAYLLVKHTSNGTGTKITPNEIRLRDYFNNGARIWCSANQSFYICGSGESDYYVFLGVWGNAWAMCPNGDNKLYLGQSGSRWRTVYAVNSSINTSDRNKKKDIEELDDFAKDFIMALKPVSYKRIDGDRTHYGMIAQDVEDSMTEFGMTAMDFAGLCKDTKDEEYYEEEIQEDGSTFKMLKHRKIEGEFDYGLRYEEFIAPMIKTIQLQQQEIEELKHRIDILEGK